MLNYDLEGPKWTTSVVTWSFAQGGAPFTSAITGAYQDTIRAAVAQWNAVANVTLAEVAPGTAGTDITVGWGSFSGGQIGETDYSYENGSTQSFLPGMTIRIEDPSIIALGAAPGSTYQGTSTNLLEVALHEFGHALGLGLSSDPNAVMNLYLGLNNTTIDASDLAGIEALYGTPAPPATGGTTSSGSAPGAPAPAAPGTIAVGADEVGVYRFFSKSTGTQFLTGSVSEADAVIATRPDMAYEGLAMAGVTQGTDDPNAVPVYRFFDVTNGTHFFTTSQAEAATVSATRPDLVAEQSGFEEHSVQEAGDVAVYRFFDSVNGTHFFSDSDGERANLVATRPDLHYEGIAFYAPSAG